MSDNKFNKKDIESIKNLIGIDVTNRFFDNDLVLQAQVAEELADVLSDKLCEVGLNENDEPNDVGYMIESLIDKCNRIIYQ